MRFRLPPLNTLRLFEAAGRHQSFKAAAEELGVTPSAVSHGVSALEDWLGTLLFHRSRRGINLTAIGKAYLPAVTDSLTFLASAVDQIPRGGPQLLQISAAPTFASRLILPRLHRFRERHPEIAVSIDTAHRVVEFPRDRADLAIRPGLGNWPGLVAERLVTERLVPVCAPALLEHRRAADLTDVPLIHVTSVSEDWEAWARRCGRGGIDVEKAMKVDTVQMAIEAALEGLGVAIGRRPFVDPELSSGALVPFVTCEIVSETSYWLVAPAEAMQRSDVQAFRSWLLDELAEFRQTSPSNDRAAPGDQRSVT